MIVSKKCSFDAAHYLPNYQGKCKNLHGHHWVVELAVNGKLNGSTGMVVDFTILNEFLKGVEDTFDHHLVNSIIPNPTAENIANYIKELYLGLLGKADYSLEYIRVWETEDSMAEVGRYDN